MNIPNRTAIEQHARLLRREEISRLLRVVTAAITDGLRQRHEDALRRPSGAVRMRSANATPV